eukprot:jgi/Chrzof1/6787/Cz19g09130.t1
MCQAVYCCFHNKYINKYDARRAWSNEAPRITGVEAPAGRSPAHCGCLLLHVTTAATDSPCSPTIKTKNTTWTQTEYINDARRAWSNEGPRLTRVKAPAGAKWGAVWV